MPKQSTSRPQRGGGCLGRGLLLLAVAMALFGTGSALHPPLLLDSVDAVRAVAGPAPVAYVETAFFRVGTLFRRARVGLGDTAPRWTLAVSPAPAPPPTAAPATTPTPQPTATQLPPAIATITATNNATQLPTATATITITNYNYELATLLRGGNLRSEPRIAPETVAGLLWPGDRVAVYERRQEGATLWLRVRVEAAARDRGGSGAEPGAAGWVSALLLSPPPTATPIPPTPAPDQPNPATPGQPAPTQVRPTVRPIQVQPPPFQPLPPSGARQDWPPAPLPALIGDGQLPGEGQWQLVGAAGDGGDARMAVTALRPDPERPDIQVALVAVDMTRAELRLVAGTEEPPVISGTLRYGAVPADVQGSGRLLAAFNGGFKAIHGADGMAADGEVYAQPVRGRATIGVLRDGSLRLGVWGRDIGPGDDLAAWRQNGRLLVDGGAVTEAARAGGLGWGASVDLQAETWRSGVGLSADGRTLFYAVGDALTAARLAEVLRAAGSASALQLDINNYWVRFVTFQLDAQGRLFAQPLITAMAREPRKYLAPERRDFFYLTAR
ncbi:MAG TPA: phosphodiester glycosidase family protein [Roseiflexaceae bacterium]|nr:phosphodiester glycosidase family protein [Roseiflexaceae bacterium]